MVKKYFFFVIVFLIGIISLVSGSSYAILKGKNMSVNEQIIKSGSVELKLEENFDNIDKGLAVYTDVDGLMQFNYYEFSLTNIGTTSAKYDLSIINETPDNYTGRLLPLKYIHVGLEVNGKEIGPIDLEKSNTIVSNDIINEKEVIHYKLRIWFDINKKKEIEKLSDKAFLKIKVDARQN